jgi:hypothetical protein
MNNVYKIHARPNADSERIQWGDKGNNLSVNDKTLCIKMNKQI